MWNRPAQSERRGTPGFPPNFPWDKVVFKILWACVLWSILEIFGSCSLSSFTSDACSFGSQYKRDLCCYNNSLFWKNEFLLEIGPRRHQNIMGCPQTICICICIHNTTGKYKNRDTFVSINHFQPELWSSGWSSDHKKMHNSRTFCP